MNKKVIIIDDSDIVRCAVSEHLQKYGFETFELPSAIGSSSLILREGIQLAVIDVSMPGMSGESLVKLFRTNKSFDFDLSIIIMTEKSKAERDRLKATSGADEVISKEEMRKLPLMLLMFMNNKRGRNAYRKRGLGIS